MAAHLKSSSRRRPELRRGRLGLGSLDNDTIRRWHGSFIEEGLEGLTRFEAGGSVGQLSGEQQDKLKAWVGATLPAHDAPSRRL